MVRGRRRRRRRRRLRPAEAEAADRRRRRRRRRGLVSPPRSRRDQGDTTGALLEGAARGRASAAALLMGAPSALFPLLLLTSASAGSDLRQLLSSRAWARCWCLRWILRGWPSEVRSGTGEGSSDFSRGIEMDVLKSEILRKRQLVEDRNLLVENKKYFKRSELAKKEEEAYFERCGYKIQPKEEDQKPLTSSNPVLELELAEEKLPMTLSRQEVIRRLRERGEPIRLFGETDYDAFQRLRKIEILTPEVNKGLRNDLKAALDKIDQQYLNEIVGGQEPGEEDTQNDLKVHEENTTIEELEALGESLGKGDDHKDMDIITKFLKFLLGVWAKELNAREDYVKRSVQGKLNSATQKQTESYLRPLFRKLRKRNLPADIKESITDIIKFMLQREYVKANDAYLQMAIGNAPWPIGVTMVGIHARTGREKIFSKHVAHVLNDETQRKYIQAEWTVRERDREKGLPFTVGSPSNGRHGRCADPMAGAKYFSWSPMECRTQGLGPSSTALPGHSRELAWKRGNRDRIRRPDRDLNPVCRRCKAED
ncbi:pre-mRNA-splicing factor 18 isoform X4 [Oryctolagus cuniculus]|uniref:pre-mRNA-splicing factor 18 isoform X4 n=1 Tax=Oryctolagus cuniculus TaxID=9986 RepID=UPI0038792793